MGGLPGGPQSLLRREDGAAVSPGRGRDAGNIAGPPARRTFANYVIRTVAVSRSTANTALPSNRTRLVFVRPAPSSNRAKETGPAQSFPNARESTSPSTPISVRLPAYTGTLAGTNGAQVEGGVIKTVVGGARDSAAVSRDRAESGPDATPPLVVTIVA